MGCGSGLLLLLLVAAAVIALWLLVIRPSLRETARNSLREGLSGQVETIDTVAIPPSGAIVLSEEEITQRLRENLSPDLPVSDPNVSISATEMRLSFAMFGLKSAFSGRPVVESGRIRILDGDLSGPAAQVLSTGDAANLVEEQLDLLLERVGVRPTAVELEPGRLTVTTAPNP